MLLNIKMNEKVETISLKQFSNEEKLLLLKELGFQTDGKFVLDKRGDVIKDKYIGVAIRLDNMLIFPGSAIVLDNNELSITLYLKEYGNRF